MKRPGRPAPADLVREARRCEAEAHRWERRYLGDATASMAEVVHAHGRVGHWRWEVAARAACGPLRWGLVVPAAPAPRDVALRRPRRGGVAGAGSGVTRMAVLTT